LIGYGDSGLRSDLKHGDFGLGVLMLDIGLLFGLTMIASAVVLLVKVLFLCRALKRNHDQLFYLCFWYLGVFVFFFVGMVHYNLSTTPPGYVFFGVVTGGILSISRKKYFKI
jgi:hypothetical protein